MLKNSAVLNIGMTCITKLSSTLPSLVLMCINHMISGFFMIKKYFRAGKSPVIHRGLKT